MKNIKRRVLWFVPALAALVFLMVCLVRFQGQIERQKQDYALIAAIKTDNFDAAQKLIADHANPNCRDLPPNTRTLWQKFLNVLRPAPPEDRAAPSALSLVVGRYIYDEYEASLREQRFALLKTLRDAGAKPEGDAPEFQSRWAALAEETRRLPESPLIEGGGRTPDEIRADLQACLSAIGVSAQVYGILGHCYEKSGEREIAVRAYRVALLWLPTDAELQARFTELTAAPAAKQAIARILPAGTKILRILLFQTVGGTRQWAVLSGKRQSDRQLYDLRAALYEEDGEKFTRLCQSPQMTNPKNINVLFDEADLFVVRATGRSLPEIVTRVIHEDPKWQPSHLDIWEINQGRFENILSLSSDSDPSLQDLRHDGHYEARNAFDAGSGGPHGEWSGMLHRRDVYAFNGKRYVFADPDFPEQFTDCIKEGEERLTDAPNDSDVLRHLAYFYQITGKPQKSEAYYREAEELCRAELRDEIAQHFTSAETARARKELRHILARDAQTDY